MSIIDKSAASEQKPVAYRHLHEDGWEYYDAPTGDDCSKCEPLFTRSHDSAARISELEAEVKHLRNFSGEYYDLSTDRFIEILALKEKLRVARDALLRVKTEEAPSYHDCLDDGLPQCAWCDVSEALATIVD